MTIYPVDDLGLNKDKRRVLKIYKIIQINIGEISQKIKSLRLKIAVHLLAINESSIRGHPLTKKLYNLW